MVEGSGVDAVDCLWDGGARADLVSVELVLSAFVIGGRGGAVKWLETSGVVFREICGEIDLIMLKGIVGPRWVFFGTVSACKLLLVTITAGLGIAAGAAVFSFAARPLL